jgi:hypothetical protein
MILLLIQLLVFAFYPSKLGLFPKIAIARAQSEMGYFNLIESKVSPDVAYLAKRWKLLFTLKFP